MYYRIGSSSLLTRREFRQNVFNCKALSIKQRSWLEQIIVYIILLFKSDLCLFWYFLVCLYPCSKTLIGNKDNISGLSTNFKVYNIQQKKSGSIFKIILTRFFCHLLSVYASTTFFKGVRYLLFQLNRSLFRSLQKQMYTKIYSV
jgi:hypothetical protein